MKVERKVAILSGILFAIPALAQAGNLVLNSPLPAGSSLTGVATYSATTQLVPLCGGPDFDGGYVPNSEDQTFTGQVQPDGTYQLVVNLKAPENLPGDKLNICHPKLGGIEVDVTLPGKKDSFTIYTWDTGDTIDISNVKDLAAQYGDSIVSGQTYEGVYIPNFSEDANYTYTISLSIPLAGVWSDGKSDFRSFDGAADLWTPQSYIVLDSQPNPDVSGSFAVPGTEQTCDQTGGLSSPQPVLVSGTGGSPQINLTVIGVSPGAVVAAPPAQTFSLTSGEIFTSAVCNPNW